MLLNQRLLVYFVMLLDRNDFSLQRLYTLVKFFYTRYQIQMLNKLIRKQEQ